MKILLGVSASIAIYKACELVRELTKKNIQVQVIMTKTASEWISPVVFEALSENTVFTTKNSGEAMPHIKVREKTDLFLIAPATADIIARAALGRADDIISATLLSFKGPRWFAPSMNPHMYNHKATQKNLQTLQNYGYHILDPQNGEAVCGDPGHGKMASVQNILKELDLFLHST